MQIQKYAGDRYTYPCRPKSGDHAPAQALSMKPTKPTSRSCRGRRPPSATGVAPRRESHTYGEDDFLRAPIQGRAAEDLDRKSSSTAVCLWWRNTHPVHDSNCAVTIKREREREKLVCLSKARGTHIYRWRRETISLG